MARIRSIKPDTFISDDVNGLSVHARWTFVGLWCYVDDEGRGRADSRLIKAAVWPIDDSVTPAEVARHLDDMERRRMICRYEVDGIAFMHVVNFDKHQRINRATESKLPPCSKDVHGGLTESASIEPCPLTEPSVSPHRTVIEGSPPEQGTGKGNREQGVPPTAGELAPAAPNGHAEIPPDTAQALIGEWIDHCRKRPPGNVIGQVGKQVKAMLSEGIETADVRAGLAEWWRKGLHPSTLPAVVNETMNASPAARASPNGRPATSDLRLAEAAEAGARLKARLASEGRAITSGR